MILTGENRSTGGETCPSAILSTSNPTWTDPGSNPGLRVERPEPWHGLAMALPATDSCYRIISVTIVLF
jgi:hypothetical protein